MVFSGLYPIDGSDYPALRDALDRLKLNDAALVYEPETSAALGFGFRVGFLGTAAPRDHPRAAGTRVRPRPHLDRAQRRSTRSTVEDGVHVDVTNPSEFPDGKIAEVREPVVRATILAPSEFIGAIMELCQQRRGSLRGMDYLSRSGSSCATRCRSPRSSSTSSTS